MTTLTSYPLANLRIIITKPDNQAHSLSHALTQLGAIPILFPLITIVPLAHPSQQTGLAQLEAADIVIFISPNAVKYSAPLLQQLTSTKPQRLRFAAIGQTTAQALTALGIANILHPATDFCSEGLLALPAFHTISQQKIVVVRGEGGRDLLVKELKIRGASVSEIICYQRQPAQHTLSLSLFQTSDIISLTSLTSLQYLNKRLATVTYPWHERLQFIVSSQRLATEIFMHGFIKPAIIANNAGDQAMIDALITWREQPDE